MNQFKNPKWWDATHDFAWDHIKRAMRKHWQQAKLSFYSNGRFAFNRVTDERITLPCVQSTFDELESACRFGYGAHIEYGESYPQWNAGLENRLVKDWWTMNPNREQTWEHDREAIRYGWEFEEKEIGRNPEGEEWKQN